MAEFTVVTPARGAAAFIDTYFAALTGQTIGFSQSIHCVVVLDGEDDEFVQRFSYWQAQFPENITLVEQKQAGISAARNAALALVRTKWISFIDADDFVNADYFLEVRNAIEAAERKKLAVGGIVSRIMSYSDQSQTSSEVGLMRDRFGDEVVTRKIVELDAQPYLRVAGLTIPTAHLRETGQRFDERVAPRGEGTRFINDYLRALAPDRVLLHVGKAIYQHRQGGGAEEGWDDPRAYDAQLRFGLLEPLLEARQAGAQPRFLQGVALYEVCRHLRFFVDRVGRSALVPLDERQAYLELLADVIRAVPVEAVHSLNVPRVDQMYRVGMTKLARLPDVVAQRAFINEHDQIKGLLQARYYSNSSYAVERFKLDGAEVVPLYPTIREHRLLGTTFAYERIAWLPLGNSRVLTVEVGNVPTSLSVAGQSLRRNWIEVSDAVARLAAVSSKLPPLTEADLALRDYVTGDDAKQRFDGCWLFTDRDNAADDNAEHFYRHVVANRPDINAYFGLRSDSPDWARLHDEGFRLIEYGSLDFKAALINAELVISSQTAGYMYRGLDRRTVSDLIQNQVVFLQHGVIKDDLSTGLSRQQIDMFVTSTRPEYESIALDGRYRFSDKQTVLTGLPRHDRLVGLRDRVQRQILVMPTWRGELAGPLTGIGTERAKNPDFADSEYARAWRGLLSSRALSDLLKATGFSIVFCPHPNVQPYLEDLNLPDHVRTTTQAEGSLQDLFAASAIMITDYSSVAFEMALLRRPVVYYQFDAQTFFSGSHTYEDGYFDYRKHAFGPVVETEAALLAALRTLLVADGRPSPALLARIDATFAFQDQDNCARVLEALDQLRSPEIEPSALDRAKLDAARRARREKRWDGQREAWLRLLDERRELNAEACLSLAAVDQAEGRMREATSWLDRAEAALRHAPEGDPDRALFVERGGPFDPAQAYPGEPARKGAADLAGRYAKIRTRLVRPLPREDMPEALPSASEGLRKDAQVEQAAAAAARKDWIEAASLLEVARGELDQSDLLRLARYHRMAQNFAAAQDAISRVDDSSLALETLREKAQQASDRHDWPAVLAHWTELVALGHADDRTWWEVGRSRRELGDLAGAKSAFAKCRAEKFQKAIDRQQALIASEEERWSDAVTIWVRVIRDSAIPWRAAHLNLATALMHVGDRSEARRQLNIFHSSGSATVQSKELSAELNRDLLASGAGVAKAARR